MVKNGKMQFDVMKVLYSALVAVFAFLVLLWVAKIGGMYPSNSNYYLINKF